QLVREGVIVSEERGFSLPVYNAKKLADGFEVHLLLDPKLAALAAANCTAEQLKALSKIYARVLKAYESDNYTAYIDASNAFRVAIREACDNEPLRRCSALIEDQFLAVRREFLKLANHRELDFAFNKKIF